MLYTEAEIIEFAVQLEKMPIGTQLAAASNNYWLKVARWHWVYMRLADWYFMTSDPTMNKPVTHRELVLTLIEEERFFPDNSMRRVQWRIDQVKRSEPI